MTSRQTIQNVGRATRELPAFLTTDGRRVGAVAVTWTLVPVAPDTYEVLSDAGSLQVDGCGAVVVKKTPGAHWTFSQIKGRQFRVSTGGKFLTAHPMTGSLSVRALAKGGTQNWRCLEVAQKARIVHTNFVLQGDGRSSRADAGTYSNPIHGGLGWAADPAVFFSKGDGQYYLAATDVSGVWTSRNLVTWTPAGTVDAQATFWAPEIFEMPAVPGGYAMIFCNGVTETRVLSSSSPAGPYEPYANLGRPGGGFPMDPHVFRDEDGQHYLYTSAFGTAGAIEVRRVSPDLRTVDPRGETCVRVLQQPGWMKEMVAEGPQVLKRVDERGAATYYLTFSANMCCKAPCYYAIGVATAPHPMGPWTLADYNPVLKWDASYGYGHHVFTVGPNGGLAVVFQRDPGSFSRELMLTAAHFEKTGRLVFDADLYKPSKPLP